MNERCDIEQRRTKAIQELRDKIALRPELNENTEDRFLLQFLKAKKFIKDDAFQLLCNYYEFRKNNKELFTGLTLPELRYVLEDGFPCVLTDGNENSAKMMVLFAGTWDIEKYQLKEILKAIILSLEEASEIEEIQEEGIYVIVDFSGWCSDHTSQLKVTSLKQIVWIFQECLPIRINAVHLINQPWYINALVILSRAFFKGSHQLQVYLHGNNMTTLHKHFSIDYLPAEFGGNKPEVDQSYWLRFLLKTHKQQPVTRGKNPLSVSMIEHNEASVSETTALLSSVD